MSAHKEANQRLHTAPLTRVRMCACLLRAGLRERVCSPLPACMQLCVHLDS
jgi:hypothetical protein